VATNPVMALGSYFLPYGAVTDPAVVLDGSTWRMWFTGMDYWVPVMGTVYSESSDGHTWSTQYMAPAGPNRQMSHVLVPDAPTAWDGKGVETPAVVKVGNGWRMFFTGDVPPDPPATEHSYWLIGTATSLNGRDWVKHAGPVLTPTLGWEGYCASNAGITPPACCPRANGMGCDGWIGGVYEPTVVYDQAAGQYRLWYVGLGLLGGVFAGRVGYATSSDGIQWTKHATPVFGAGAAGSWDAAIAGHPNVVADPVMGFHMFYYGVAAEDPLPGIDPGGLGHAFSADGLVWERNPGKPGRRTSGGVV